MRNIFGFLALVAVIFTACNDNQFKGFDKTESGLYYKIHTQGTDTIIARNGDLISLYINYRTLKDSLFNTNSTLSPVDVHMRESDYKGDIFEGLRLVSIGDSATFVVSTDSFFTKVYRSQIPEYLDSGSYFYIDVKIENIFNKQQQEKRQQEEMQKLQAQEISLMDSYIRDNDVKEEADSNGIYKILTQKGKGKNIVSGNYSKINLKFHLLDNNQPIYNSWENANGPGIDIMVGTGYFGVGLDNCLVGAKEGDAFTAIIPSAMAFGARGVEKLVPPYSPLVYECEVVSTFTEAEYQAQKKKEAEEMKMNQKKDVQKYLKEHNITSKPDADGIYKQLEVSGMGTIPVAGDKVSVHYTGFFLDGTKFDSSEGREPFDFVIGTGAVIKGWDKALSTMKVGEKSLFIIPSDLAYGPQGRPGAIPPNSVLVFEIELININGK